MMLVVSPLCHHRGDDDYDHDDDDLTAKNKRRAMLTKGPMAFAIELITTWRPKKNRN